MHVLALPSPYRETLYQMQGPQITEVVKFRVASKQQTGTTPGGVPIFSTAYAYHEFEVQDRLLEPIQYMVKKYRYPSDEREVEVADNISISLALLNTDGYLAATQAGAGLRPGDIEQGEVWIYADIGVGNPIELFKGRIEGRPSEMRGKTIVRCVGSLYESIRKPILYEDFGNVGGTNQAAVAVGQMFIANPARIPCLGYHFCAYHGIVRWDSSGKPAPAAKQEGGWGVLLNRVGLSNGVKPGTYAIEFKDSRNYTLTYPDSQVFAGNISAPLVGEVSIAPSDWSGSDGSGVRIEFSVGVAYQGNPVCIALNLIEKSLANNYGALPGQLPLLKIDVPTWTRWAKRFAHFRVHVDATNKDNSVWARTAGNKPISYAALAQQILDHVCCRLSINLDGAITLIGPYLDDSDIWPTTTKEAILADGITINGGEAYNRLNLSFGQHSEDGNYAHTLTQDLRINPVQDFVDLTVGLPFYKYPQGTQQAQWAMETIARRCLAKQYTVTAQVSPMHGLPMEPGDVAQLTSNASPFLQQNVEVIGVNKSVGGVCSVEYAPIQQPEGEPAAVCTARLTEVSLW